MKKVIFILSGLFLSLNVHSQTKCFDLYIENELLVPKNERLLFHNDLKFLYSENLEYNDGTTVSTYYFEEFEDRFNSSICPEYEGKWFTGYWFSVQNNRVIAKSNGNSIWFTPTSTGDISTCFNIFVRDENYQVIGTEMVSCVKSSFNGKNWETVDIDFEEIEIIDNEVLYDFNYVDFN